VLFGIRAVAESGTPAGSFSHIVRILAQGVLHSKELASLRVVGLARSE
jgi:hypothetical protein